MEKFLELVKDERVKQINKHGYTHEHDDGHTDGSIADAAACYAATAQVYKIKEFNELFPMKTLYPWGMRYFKKEEKSRKDQIITACAMLMAEWERLDRIEKKATVHLCDDCNLSFHNCKSNHKFGTGAGNDNVYECDTFQPKPYQMSCPYGYDMIGHSDE